MTTPPPTVLVVDDDRANLDSVARIFQREGLETLTASNGTEALELLRRPEVSVMVTDLMMPGMDGQELLKASRTIRPDVEVVLMTAYGTVETAVAAMKDGRGEPRPQGEAGGDGEHQRARHGGPVPRLPGDDGHHPSGRSLHGHGAAPG
jgi:CheY-like chemotaxis protein